MALGTPVSVGVTAPASANSATVTHTTAGAIPAAATAVIIVGSSTTNRPLSSVTDSAGNTWTIAVDEPHSVSSTNVALAFIYLPSGLASGTTITATYASSVLSTRGMAVLYIPGRGEIDRTTSRESATNSAAWTSNATSATTASGCVAVGGGYLATASSNSNTTGSSPAFTELHDNNGGSRTLTSQYATGISSGTAVTAGGTWANISAWTAVVAVFKEHVAGVTYTDTASGTVALSGAAAGTHQYTEAASGTVGLAGTATDARAHADALAGTAQVSGSVTDVHSVEFHDAPTGTAQITGTVDEATTRTDTQAGTVTVTGTAEDIFGTGFADTMAGTLTVTGTTTEDHFAVDAPTGIVALTGDVVSAYQHSDAPAGTVAVTGTAVDELAFLHAAIVAGIVFVSGATGERYIPAGDPAVLRLSDHPTAELTLTDHPTALLTVTDR